MARIIGGSVKIGTTKVNIGSAPNIAPAGLALAATATAILGKASRAQQTEQANLDAQNLEFGRDEQGRLIAPVFAEKGGILPPSTYTREYESMVLNRYRQQISIDASSSINQIANENLTDPEAFRANAEGYRNSLLETAMPQAAAEVQLALDTQIVQYHNKLSNDLATREREESIKVQFFTLQNMATELSGEIHAGLDPQGIAELRTQYMEEVSIGRGLELYSDAEVLAFEQEIDQRIVRSSIAATFDGTPITRVALTNAINKVDELMHGDPEIEVPIKGRMKKIKVSEFFPSLEERQQAFGPLQQMLRNRETGRAAYQQALWNQDLVNYSTDRMIAIDQAIQTGDPLSDSMTRQLQQAESLALRSGNLVMLNKIMRQKDRNLSNIVERGEQMTADNVAEMNARTTEQILGESPEMLAIVNEMTQDFVGMDVDELLNPIDPTGLGMSQTLRERNVQRFINFARAKLGGASDPKWMQDINRQALERQETFNRLVKEWTNKNGPAETPDQKLQMMRDIDQKMPLWDLSQNINTANWMNEVITRHTNENATQDWWQTTSREHGMEVINTIVRQYGVIPSSLSAYINGVLNNEQADNPTLARALDFARGLWDVQGISGAKFHAASGLGNHGVTLRALFMKSLPGQVQPDKFVRDAIQRGTEGLSPYQSHDEFMASNPNAVSIRDTLNDELSNAFSGISNQFGVDWIFGIGNPYGVHGEPIQDIEVPADMRTQAFNATQSVMHKYDMSIESQRLLAIQEGIKQTIEQFGWLPSKFGYSPVRGEQPFFYDFGGMLISDIPDSGVGILLQIVSQDMAWAQDAPENRMNDAQLMIFERGINTMMKGHPRWKGTKFKLGVNVYASLNEEATVMTGVDQWQLWVKKENRTYSMVTNLDGTGIMTVEFSKEFAALEDKQVKDRIAENDQTDRLRLLHQALAAQQGQEGRDSETNKEVGRLMREIDANR